MNCTHSQYNLPTISFIGGETQSFTFTLYSGEDKTPLDLAGCDCDFSITNALNTSGTPVLTKSMNVDSGNILGVELLSTDTVGLFGKYIYQIAIKDAVGNISIPGQGIFYIRNNINKSFVS